jgi:hypothetical protein
MMEGGCEVGEAGSRRYDDKTSWPSTCDDLKREERRRL